MSILKLPKLGLIFVPRDPISNPTIVQSPGMPRWSFPVVKRLLLNYDCLQKTGTRRTTVGQDVDLNLESQV
jgi:hypothetical protein